MMSNDKLIAKNPTAFHNYNIENKLPERNWRTSHDNQRLSAERNVFNFPFFF